VSWPLVLLTTANGLIVATLGAARVDIPAGFWPERGWLVVLLLLFAAIMPAAQTVLAHRGDRRRRQQLELEQRVNAILAAALVQATHHAHCDWETTGIQAFTVRRRRLHRDDQVRVGKVRLAPVPSSGIRWTTGKGAIGRCWERSAVVIADLATDFHPFLAYTKQEWDGMAHETRYGLTFEEFQRVKDKYGLVVAVPIFSASDRYVGCITADMPPGAHTAAVNRQALVAALSLAAQLASPVVSQ
jgi:hypothetical protein